MKKLALLVAFALFCGAVQAQDVTVDFAVDDWDGVESISLNFDPGATDLRLVHGLARGVDGAPSAFVGACWEEPTQSEPILCQVNYFGNLLDLSLLDSSMMLEGAVGGFGRIDGWGQTSLTVKSISEEYYSPPTLNPGVFVADPTGWNDLRMFEIANDYIDGNVNCGIGSDSFEWKYENDIQVLGSQSEYGCLAAMRCTFEWQYSDGTYGKATLSATIRTDTSVSFNIRNIRRPPMWLTMRCNIHD